MKLLPRKYPMFLFCKIKIRLLKGIRITDVKGVVQHYVYFSFECDKTVKIKILRKIDLPGHSGHPDEKNDVLNNIFRYLIPLIWMI